MPEYPIEIVPGFHRLRGVLERTTTDGQPGIVPDVPAGDTVAVYGATAAGAWWHVLDIRGRIGMASTAALRLAGVEHLADIPADTVAGLS